MNASKVIVDGETIVDLTGDTATPETVAEGETFHDATGEPRVGTMTTAPVVQETGDSETAVMSQKAVTAALGNKVDAEEGKGLSENDLTDDLKAKYDEAHEHTQNGDVHVTADEKQALTEAAAKVGTVEQLAEAAEASATEAANSDASARQSKDEAVAAKAAAEAAAARAETAENAAEQSATVAASAKAGAEAAQTAAEAARDEAGQQATTATNAAQTATTAASDATNVKYAVETEKNLAETARNEAEQAAINAATSASTAEQSASAASTYATNAGKSATAAAGSATTASDAASSAQTAQQAAETAKGQAEQSETNAAASASSAQTAAETATSAKTAAETAKSGAETAKNTATSKATEATTAAQTATSKATEATEAAATAQTAKNEAQAIKEEVERKLANGDYKGEDGKSAYQYAKEGGFSGSEADFIVKLAKCGQLAPEFANSVDECTDPALVYVLPDGYLYAYVKTTEVVKNYDNLAKNFQAGEYNASANIVDNGDGSVACADYIQFSQGTKIRIKGLRELTDKNIVIYTGNKSPYSGHKANNPSVGSMNTYSYDSTTGVVTLESKLSSATYLRVAGYLSTTVDDVIITRNQEITEKVVASYKWTNTGHAFVPADYEGRIIGAETRLDEHDAAIKNLKESQVKGLSVEYNSCSIFRKVVCCGDSFTCGYIATTMDNIVQTNYDFSWPSFMARLTGNEYINCGQSGKTVLTWQTAENGLPKARATGKAQAYLIGLGLNDAAYVTLGTVDDIGTDAQTYYGGMSKIIREINAISPMAKIFVQTIPDGGHGLQNQAVRDIVAAYKDTYPVHLLDLYAYSYMYTTSKLTEDAILGHYTAIGYQQFAENLRYIWSDYINKNVSAFQDVYLIPYDETT